MKSSNKNKQIKISTESLKLKSVEISNDTIKELNSFVLNEKNSYLIDKYKVIIKENKLDEMGDDKIKEILNHSNIWGVDRAIFALVVSLQKFDKLKG